MSPLYCALVHYPVCDRRGEVVTTSITNLDVHDIARSSRTYGLAGYFVVTPIDAQRQILDRILEHWLNGQGVSRQPARGAALGLLQPVESVSMAIRRVTAAHSQAPRIWATSARPGPDRVSFCDAAATLKQTDQPTLLLLGTGNGLAPAALDLAEAVLEPVAAGGYNHLSVRAAAAVMFDRLRRQP